MRKGSKPVNWFSLRIPSEIQFDNTIKDILKGVAYRHLNNPIKDLYEGVKAAIQKWLLNILVKTFSNIPNPESLSKNVSTIFMIIGIIAIVAIVIIIIVKINKTLEKRGRIKEILGERIDDNTTPKSLRLKAETLYKEGNYREAIRFDFIGLLLLMHEKNVVFLDETKTNKEIFEYLSKKSFLHIEVFGYLSNAFNSSWYGHKHSDEESLKAWSNNINVLWNEVISYEEKDK
jgi:hypothetical protein